MQVYNQYIKEAIIFSLSKGDSPREGIPLPLWPNNRYTFFKLTVFIFPLVPLTITFIEYGFWAGIITGALVSMIAFGLGKLWMISTLSKIKR